MDEGLDQIETPLGSKSVSDQLFVTTHWAPSLWLKTIIIELLILLNKMGLKWAISF